MLLFLLASFCFLSTASAVAPTVNVHYASYRGTALAGGITQWLGMRYAAPPVGQLRFAAPEDPNSVRGVQPADKVPPSQFCLCLSCYVC